MWSFLQKIKTILQWNYAEDLLLAGYIIVLEQVAKNMTQLLLNAITKWHSVCPCRDVH